MSIKVEFIESYIKPDGSGDYIWHDNHGELIRCKDCYWWDRSWQLIETRPELRNCKKLRTLTREDWYCAEGRRKDETALQD